MDSFQTVVQPQSARAWFSSQELVSGFLLVLGASVGEFLNTGLVVRTPQDIDLDVFQAEIGEKNGIEGRYLEGI